MGKRYEHLSAKIHAMIQVEFEHGDSLPAIAERSVWSVARGVKRNGVSEVVCGVRYQAIPGGGAQAYRRRHERCVLRHTLRKGEWLHHFVHEWLLYWRSSPEQIRARLRRTNPDQPQRHVSHETINAAI